MQDQIMHLTGVRYLPGYTDNISQFNSLMNNEMNYADKLKLVLGVELIASQMNVLTSDLVWLVNETMALPNGKLETVIVPKVYTKVRNKNIVANGSIISAKNINLETITLENDGVLLAQNDIPDDNVLAQQFELDKPNQFWTGDATYIRTKRGGVT